jgi:cytoskeletal protein CcmA (bactofilin family)
MNQSSNVTPWSSFQQLNRISDQVGVAEADADVDVVVDALMHGPAPELVMEEVGADDGSENTSPVSAAVAEIPRMLLVEASDTAPSGQEAPRPVQETIVAVSDAKTCMPKGWTIVGDIESSNGVVVGCDITGNVQMKSAAQVCIERGARVEGIVTGTDVVIRGELDGEVNAAGGSVSIEEGARIVGKVTYSGIRMEGGMHKMELVHVPRSETLAA